MTRIQRIDADKAKTKSVQIRVQKNGEIVLEFRSKIGTLVFYIGKVHYPIFSLELAQGLSPCH